MSNPDTQVDLNSAEIIKANVFNGNVDLAFSKASIAAATSVVVSSSIPTAVGVATGMLIWDFAKMVREAKKTILDSQARNPEGNALDAFKVSHDSDYAKLNFKI